MTDKVDPKLFKALLAFQKTPPTISKDGANPHFRSKYATLDNIMKETLPLLNKNGLVVTQHPATAEDGLVSVTTYIHHAETGASIHATVSSMTSGDSQKVGSAITYLRRYGLSSILGLVTDEDDDGNAAGAGEKKPEKEQGRKGFTDKFNPQRKEIAELALELAEGDMEYAKELIEEASAFEKDDKKIPGKKSPKELSDARCGPTLGRIREDHKARFGSSEEDKAPEFADQDIPF
jgi:hypothetical protein